MTEELWNAHSAITKTSLYLLDLYAKTFWALLTRTQLQHLNSKYYYPNSNQRLIAFQMDKT